MTPGKEKALHDTYDVLYQIVLGDYPIDKLPEFISEDVMGYGTNKDEKILNISGFNKLIKDQREQGVGMEMSFETHPVFRRVNPSAEVAIYVDEVHACFLLEGTKNEFLLRVSWIFEFIKDKWILTHWHGSKAVEIEGDTWMKEEWKKKNEELQKKVDERTLELKKSLADLKAAQSQLIQSEKMASLGELTAGIAHEIQNPLNFVNNFSEVSKELLNEMKAELVAGNWKLATELADDIIQNLEKINHHGKRADSIVKAMLQHSRKSSNQKEWTDINALCDEYLRLSYHGLRAKEKSFNAKFETDFDASLPKLNVIPQDLGRVILNLINNAFYAVNERTKQGDKNYEPQVLISTKKENDQVFIFVKDNGTGIPHKVFDKIFQPFFTTKPTGEGTGLGLSLSYDIIKAHGGELKVETREGEGSTFIISLSSQAIAR